MNYRRNEDRLRSEGEHTDNIILDVDILSEDALLSAGVLRSEYYPGDGTTIIEHEDLVGVTIVGVWAGNQDFAPTDGAPDSWHYRYDSDEGTLEFSSNLGSSTLVHVVFEGAGTVSGETEPVTLQEAKDYLRLEGFIDEGESPASSLSDFDLDDSLVQDMITTARQFIEGRDNISLTPKTLSVVLVNGAGMIELPYSPIGDITSLTDEDGNTVDVSSYTLIGTNRKRLKEVFTDYRTIVYETVAAANASARLEIRRIVADLYDHRKVEGYYKKYVFSRKTWFV